MQACLVSCHRTLALGDCSGRCCPWACQAHVQFSADYLLKQADLTFETTALTFNKISLFIKDRLPFLTTEQIQCLAIT